MPFENPIVAGLKLLINAIQSPDFVAGTSGWTINKDGSAEFNNLTIRGTFQGTNFEINTTGAFFYSGTPAANNLVVAIAPAAGTDPYGNVYSLGLSVYNASGVQIGSWGTNSQRWYASGGAGTWFVGTAGQSPAMVGSTNQANTGTGSLGFLMQAVYSWLIPTADALVIDAPRSANAVDALNTLASLVLSAGTTATPAIGTLETQSSGSPSRVVAFTWTQDTSGNPLVSSAGIAAFQPGSGSLPPAREVWHTAALASGFTTGGTDQAPRYRIEPVGTGLQVRLDGTVYTSAATAANATMFTLPSAYWPAKRKRFVGSTNASGYTTPGAALFAVSTAGVVTCGVVCSASGQQIVLDGATFPLD